MSITVNQTQRTYLPRTYALVRNITNLAMRTELENAITKVIRYTQDLSSYEVNPKLQNKIDQYFSYLRSKTQDEKQIETWGAWLIQYSVLTQEAIAKYLNFSSPETKGSDLNTDHFDVSARFNEVVLAVSNYTTGNKYLPNEVSELILKSMTEMKDIIEHMHAVRFKSCYSRLMHQMADILSLIHESMDHKGRYDDPDGGTKLLNLLRSLYGTVRHYGPAYEEIRVH